jgi:hypothetical protein
MLDQENNPVPLQTKVLNIWSDRSIRWLLLDFQASIEENSPATISYELMNPNNLIIRLYHDSDRHAWDHFVMDHPGGTFFHLIGWKRVVEKSFGHASHYLMAVNSSKLKGESHNRQ